MLPLRHTEKEVGPGPHTPRRREEVAGYLLTAALSIVALAISLPVPYSSQELTPDLAR